MSSPADIAPYISIALLFVIGLGLGASTTFDNFHKAFKNPKAIAIGFLSQYLFMPVTAYLLAIIFRIRAEVAVGLILIGSSPGGTTSNLFTYWSDGNVALSVTMSFLSTAAAFALMPFWIWVFVKKALGSGAEIEWTSLIVSLLMILIPTCIGLAVRKYNTERKIKNIFIWKWIEILSSVLGILFLIATFALSIVAYGNIFKDAGAKNWILGIIMQPIGCAFGYLVSKFLGMTPIDRRTISLETGVQNFALTVAVIQLSFASDEDALTNALMFPVVYGFLYLFWSPLIVVFFKYYLAPKDYDGIEKEEKFDEIEAKNHVDFPIGTAKADETVDQI